MADANACSIAPPSPENLQRRVRKTSENPPRAAVYDVIAVAKNCDQNYAGQIYKRLLDAGKVPECAEVDQVLVQPLGSCTCMNQEGGQWGGNRKPVRVATVNEMVQILAQLPGNCHFNKACEEVIAKFLDVAPRDPDAVKFIDVADPGKEDQGTTRSWQEGSGAPPWFREAIADAVATGIEQGVKATQAAYAEQLQGLERELQKVSEYGPRIEMSRAFPSRPDELLDLGIKLRAGTDLKRLREYGLPVTTFLQEKFPEKKISRISTCFSKTLKQRRLELYREDPEEHRIFLLYHQGQWRIAYFEDDRPLMEEVLATPVMQETIQRLLGVVATEGENNKRRQTLLTAYAAPSRDEATGASST